MNHICPTEHGEAKRMWKYWECDGVDCAGCEEAHCMYCQWILTGEPHHLIVGWRREP